MAMTNEEQQSHAPEKALVDDPRQRAKVIKYKAELSEEELPADWMALLSLVAGIMGMMMRFTVASWLSLFACVASVCTMRTADFDIKQVLTSFAFALMGLFTNYLAPQPRVS